MTRKENCLWYCEDCHTKHCEGCYGDMKLQDCIDCQKSRVCFDCQLDGSGILIETKNMNLSPCKRGSLYKPIFVGQKGAVNVG